MRSARSARDLFIHAVNNRPEVRTLAALVTGGDRTALDAILAAPALAPLAALRSDRVLEVPEPRHAVLVSAIAQARAIRVLIREG